MVRKATFTLDDETIRRLASASERLKMPKSEVVRHAVADYHASIGRISETEKQRMLGVLRDMVPKIPPRPAREVDAELAEIRAARRAGGRGTTRKRSR